MDTIDEGLTLGLSLSTFLFLLSSILFPTNKLGYGAIGQQHELLDELGGICRLLKVATCGLAIVINIEVQFFPVELHGTVLKTALAQFLSHLIK